MPLNIQQERGCRVIQVSRSMSQACALNLQRAWTAFVRRVA